MTGRGAGAGFLGAAAPGVFITVATLLLLAVLWPVVGRPVENLTGALMDGLAADALAVCLAAASAGAIGIGIARLQARS